MRENAVDRTQRLLGIAEKAQGDVEKSIDIISKVAPDCGAREILCHAESRLNLLCSELKENAK